MAYYRLYSLDLEENHIVDVVSFSADSDSAAILKVRPSGLSVARELWNLSRKVMDFPPAAPIASDNEDTNRFTNLIDLGSRWRWNPLESHCQAVT